MTKKSTCVQVHFCYVFIDQEVEKRIKTYANESTAKAQITKWMNKRRDNFCRSYHHGTEKWYTHQTYSY